jgi:hypothetical protein
VRPGGLCLKNSNETIWNRSRDLPACSAVPQPLRHRVLLIIREGLRSIEVKTVPHIRVGTSVLTPFAFETRDACEMSLTVGQKRRLRVFENRVFRRIFGSKGCG